MQKKAILLFSAILLVSLSLAGCAIGDTSAALTASGQVSANEVSIAAEISGRVTQLNVQEGDAVNEGDVLFQVDDQLLRAQQSQAQAAVQTAEAALDAAKAQADSARIQEQLALQGARLQDQQSRAEAWNASQPAEFNLPVWYFQKSEQIRAAEAEVSAAEDNLQAQTEGLEQALDKSSNASFVSTEEQLSKAQAAFSVAVQILEQARTTNNQTLVDTATDAHDQALKELESAQLEYRRMSTTNSAEEILEARSKVAVAQSRLDMAHDQLSALQSGDDSIQVEVAQAAVTQAEAAISQAEAGLAQANAALDTINIQIEKTTVKAPVSGIVLSNNLKQGEIVAAGGISMTIDQLDEVELTVYVPEAEYGQVTLGQSVSIQVDSFPDKTFSGTVNYIASEADYTPRNVQTVDGRKTTVYTVKISAANPDQALKPGMPADVTFEK